MKTEHKYEDCTIRLLEDWTFFVMELEKAYPSLSDAKDAIDAAGRRIAAAKRVKLNLPVIDASGEKRAITGVHAGHGKMTISPKLEGYRCAIYPDVPWILHALKEEARLEREARRHTDLLRRFSIETNPGHSRHYTAEEVEWLHANITKKAEGTNYEAELATVPSTKIKL